MHPRIFTIPIGGGIPVHSYGVMLGLSFLTAWWLTLKLAVEDGLPKEKVGNLFVVTAVCAVIGSRLLYVITNLGEMRSFFQIFMINQGGLVAYGGFLGGFFSALYYCRKHKMSLLVWADASVPSLAVGLGFTRIGCFMYGCDYGRVTWDSAVGVQFPMGSPAWAHHYADAAARPLPFEPGVFGLWGLEKWVGVSQFSDPVHPTQIYSSLNGWVCLGFLLFVRKYYRRFTGRIFLLFFVYYAVTRFGLEEVRDDLQRGYVGPLTTSQFIAAVTFTLAAIGYAYLHRKANQDPDRWRPWTVTEQKEATGPQGKKKQSRGAARKRKGRKRRAR